MEQKYYEDQTFENLKLDGKVITDCEFVDCKFINCTFENFHLSRSTLSGCIFQKCSIISLKAKYSQIRFAEFENCNLVGIHWNELLPAGKLSKPISVFRECHLKYNTFSEMSFVRFNFSNSEITDSMFAKCELMESNFSKCKLDGTEFFECDMRKSNFHESSGYQIDIFTSKLKGAKFSFPEVISLLNGLGIKID
ncbi:MAG: pentapeptide repeat-containing protein [Ruminococcus sp.]|nr:pentapeptide repeat-containing protein [Ruminococcus sp.]